MPAAALKPRNHACHTQSSGVRKPASRPRVAHDRHSPTPYTPSMTDRLPVTKTNKLYINGAFPRSESGRSINVRASDGSTYAHGCLASRKDLRDAVRAAEGASKGWAARTAYNRGQILYRLAEMLEGKRAELVEALTLGDASKGDAAAHEVETCCDVLVAYAGWADKYAQVLGCNNPVAGPYYTFTSPEPSGVVVSVAPDEPSLLGTVALAAPLLCAGNTVVAVAPASNPVPACVLAEACHTSDLPAGVINILTGERSELIPWIAEHRSIAGVHAGGLSEDEAAALRAGAAENVKRVRTHEMSAPDWHDIDAVASPWRIEPFVEMKTIWHPAAT